MGTKSRSIKFDLLKALAIISVIFYHIGFQQFGYLGVDIFFVVGGYFLGRSLMNAAEKGKFPYVSFLIQRILRLWPLLLLAAALSLATGFFVMLPDDYENLAQSVVATDFFANNILSALTTRNYWNTVNEFKPLMHTWYVGVLVQCYVVFAFVPWIGQKLKFRLRRFCLIAFSALSTISLLLYVLPILPEPDKFYHIPARIFEIGIGIILSMLGGLLIKWKEALGTRRGVLVASQILLFVALIFLISFPIDVIPAMVRLLLVCLLTAVLVVLIRCDEQDWDYPVLSQLSFFGRASFSFFVWHQVIVAFVKYAWTAKLGFEHIVVVLALTLLVSIPSYFFIEKRIETACREDKSRLRLLIGCMICCIIISAVGMVLYLRGGVVRDVPELDVDAQNVTRGMSAEYCDRIYSYDEDFTDLEKFNILILGNSFGRDFANILLESQYADLFELSYAFEVKEVDPIRLEQADRIIFAVYGNEFSALHESLTAEGIKDKVFVVGNKGFGYNNGNIYNRRFQEDYLSSSITLSKDYFEQNDRLRAEFGDRYIDLLTPVRNTDGSIRVFTDDGKFISQDCLHLTKAGAKYYSRILDLSPIFLPILESGD